jgi:hypothetical protein
MKFRTHVLLLTVVLTLLLSSPCLAGKAGSFATALKNRFCGGTSGPEWYGCYAYMHYRVDLAKNNSAAKRYCYSNGCGKKYSNPMDRSRCEQGCDKAFASDTK